MSHDGPGIADGDRERVCGAFERLGDGDGGLLRGMGLAIVERIVENVGGRVALEGGGGRGSTFRFEWPKRISAEPDPASDRQRDDAETADR